MGTAKKFTFDTHFETGAKPAAAPQTSRSRKSYSADEIDALREKARDEGRQDGTVRQQAAVAAATGQVANSLFQAIKTLDAEVETIRAEAAQLAFAAAKKLAQAALASAPDAEIMETLREALHQAISEPRVLVQVSPDLVAAVEAQIQTLAQQEGYEGRIVIAPDASLRGGDCHMEWTAGGIEHKTDGIEQALNALIARRFPPAHTDTRKE